MSEDQNNPPPTLPAPEPSEDDVLQTERGGWTKATETPDPADRPKGLPPVISMPAVPGITPAAAAPDATAPDGGAPTADGIEFSSRAREILAEAASRLAALDEAQPPVFPPPSANISSGA